MEIVRLSQDPDCIDTVARWIWETWGRQGGQSPDQARARLLGEEACPPTLLARAEGRPLGVIGFRRYPYRDQLPAVLFIDALFVAEGCRGHGVGTALIAEAVRRARATDEALYVYTNVPAWYERFDFVVVEPQADAATVVLRRALPC